MLKHWKYLKYVVRHKWFVFLYCLQYGLIWRGIKHDWSKFLPSEWFPYVEYFYGEKFKTGRILIGANGRQDEMKPPQRVQDAFDRAWNFHQKRNSHHWQYWLLSPDNPRPNFGIMSMDGGMTHATVTTMEGEDVALVWHDAIEWWKHPPYALEKRLEADLDNTPIPLEMSDADRKEMIADWRGAGRALGKPNTWEWYAANKRHIFLHTRTRKWIEGELAKQEAAYRSDMRRVARGS